MGDREKSTEKLPRLSKGDKITIDLGDADSAADFLEHVARLIRENRKITIWVE